MKTKPTPFTAIITGLGILGFGLLYYLTGIFPSKRGGFFLSPRWDAVTVTENPFRFRFAIIVTFVVGAASLIWGLFKTMKR